jgi:hypothetical protein
MSCSNSVRIFSNRIAYLRGIATARDAEKKILKFVVFPERLGLSKCPQLVNYPHLLQFSLF